MSPVRWLSVQRWRRRECTVCDVLEQVKEGTDEKNTRTENERVVVKNKVDVSALARVQAKGLVVMKYALCTQDAAGMKYVPGGRVGDGGYRGRWRLPWECLPLETHILPLVYPDMPLRQLFGSESPKCLFHRPLSVLSLSPPELAITAAPLATVASLLAPRLYIRVPGAGPARSLHLHPPPATAMGATDVFSVRSSTRPP